MEKTLTSVLSYSELYVVPKQTRYTPEIPLPTLGMPILATYTWLTPTHP